MSGTRRTLAIPGMPVVKALESRRVRTEREERIDRQSRAAKNFACVDRRAERAYDGGAA
ncbi:hypothetical protein J2X55_002430 [Microbacterium sp. 1154]|uniref:hypothetical protein n=1 Tax=Microbacterium sp. 1154 TaxID=2817733 RepID=UPI002864CC65|nr:hypothetical protein [Microbacterium sp. 1154]MDR6691507.1 hypothetical protein [Microbacterium sp. 1154]